MLTGVFKSLFFNYLPGWLCRPDCWILSANNTQYKVTVPITLLGRAVCPGPDQGVSPLNPEQGFPPCTPMMAAAPQPCQGDCFPLDPCSGSSEIRCFTLQRIPSFPDFAGTIRRMFPQKSRWSSYPAERLSYSLP